MTSPVVQAKIATGDINKLSIGDIQLTSAIRTPGKTTSVPFLFMCESLLATGFCITFINWCNLLVYYCFHSLKYSYYLKITVVHVLLKRTKRHNVQTEEY